MVQGVKENLPPTINKNFHINVYSAFDDLYSEKFVNQYKLKSHYLSTTVNSRVVKEKEAHVDVSMRAIIWYQQTFQTS